MKIDGNRAETCSAVQTENLDIKIESCMTNYVLLFNIEIIQPSSIPVAVQTKAARLLGLWVRITPGAWMAVCCECRVLLGRGFCVGLITRPEESYRMLCVQ